MSYSGNPAIAPEVQERIRETFAQTLDLAARGSRQEASLGCDFILQLDPQFRPATVLQERLRESSGAVTVDDLRGGNGTGGPADRQQEAAALFEDTGHGTTGFGGDHRFGGGFGDDDAVDRETSFAGLDALDEELPELPDLEDFGGAAAPPAPERSGDDLAQELERLLGERRFDAVLAAAEAHHAEVTADPRLRRVVETAVARQEAAPYVESFITSAREAQARGDGAEAAALVQKAQSLDPSHPGIGLEPEAPPAAGPPGEWTGESAGGALPELEPLDDLESDADPFGAGLGPSAGLGAPGGDEGDRRIAELLAEGQAAFDRGDPQGAIDVWSRIFLIDLDHEEASRRIDRARRVKSEQERELEEDFHRAAAAYEAGRLDDARHGFETILAAQPAHAGAREMLDHLEAGEPPPVTAPRSGDLASDTLEGSALAGGALAGGALAGGANETGRREELELREEILVPPEPGERQGAVADEPEGARRRRVAVRERRTNRTFVLVGTLVLLVVAAAAWLLYQNRERLFPNAAEEPVQEQAEDPIARATRLHESGRTALAVNQLRRLPPSHPQYGEAQALITQWQAARQPEEVAVPEPAESAEERAARRSELLAAATAAADEGRYLLASEHLEEAAQLAPFEAAEETELAARVEEGLEPVARPIDLLEQGEYQFALRELWRMREADPTHADVTRLLVRAYYNLGIRELQRGDAATAAQNLEEAAALDPGDEEVARHLRFARTYAERDKDLLYRIYVKYLPPR
ncbi:MAG TPA: hypothetical protein VHQ65_12335 [Thermoanaerobaculia bacterium]|nr:hypothetical protein [Thermoanaerobaculia bacterium]